MIPRLLAGYDGFAFEMRVHGLLDRSKEGIGGQADAERNQQQPAFNNLVMTLWAKRRRYPDPIEPVGVHHVRNLLCYVWTEGRNKRRTRHCPAHAVAERRSMLERIGVAVFPCVGNAVKVGVGRSERQGGKGGQIDPAHIRSPDISAQIAGKEIDFGLPVVLLKVNPADVCAVGVGLAGSTRHGLRGPQARASPRTHPLKILIFVFVV